jgi:chemotaxis protein CheD
MHESYHHKFGKKMLVLHPGDYASSKEDIVLCTVLGSCIAVILYDSRQRCGGMNHFMLPAIGSNRTLINDEGGKYGMFAMELLVNDLLKKGIRREDMVAKVFGGGHVLRGIKTPAAMVARVPTNNIEFAYKYLEQEKIPVVASDTGGDHGRKIYLFTQTGKVLLKRITGEKVLEVVEEEVLYEKTIHRPKDDGVVFF